MARKNAPQENTRDVARYTTFKRSATSFETFSSARKIVARRNLTLPDAILMCANFNNSLTALQIKKGTKMEFEQQ